MLTVLSSSDSSRDHRFEPLGIEHATALAERPEAEAPDPQLLAELLQFAGLLQSPQRIDDGIGQGQQHQRDVLVEVKLPVARRVARRSPSAAAQAAAAGAADA